MKRTKTIGKLIHKVIFTQIPRREVNNVVHLFILLSKSGLLFVRIWKFTSKDNSVQYYLFSWYSFVPIQRRPHNIINYLKAPHFILILDLLLQTVLRRHLVAVNRTTENRIADAAAKNAYKKSSFCRNYLENVK